MAQGLDAALDDAIKQVSAARDETDDGEQPAADEPPDDGVEQPDESGEPEPGTVDTDGTSTGDDEGQVGDGETDDEGGDDGDGEQPDALEVADDATVTLSDGTKMSGRELREGWLRQSDYTRKTQAAAKARREAEDLIRQTRDWWQGVRDDPAAAINEIVTSAGANPSQTFAQTLASQGPEQATQHAAVLLRTLAEQGALAQEFVDHFGINVSGSPVGQQAQQAGLRQEVDQIRQEREREQQESKRRELVQQYYKAWDQIKDSEKLDFQDGDEERQAKVDLMRFAREKGITDLQTAWAAAAYQGVGKIGEIRKRAEQRRQKTQKKAQEAQRKQRGQQAQTRRGNRVASEQTATRPGGLDGAISKAMEEVGMSPPT